ncbi:MAG: DUF2490 domain-containing protein [Pseudomonadota bacterium]
MASAGPARAQDEDTQLWIYAVATGEVGERTTLTVDASARWREDRRGDEQQTLRATVMHEVAEGFALGGGVGVFEAGGETEIRPHQQIDLNLGRFTARTRLEERFFDGADQMELRFRQRIRYTLPLGKSASASVDGEYFNLVQTRDRGPNQPRDQWRGRVIVSADVGERFTLGLSYLYIFTPQPGATDLVNHVPQGIITYRF